MEVVFLGGVAWLVHVYTIRRQYYSKQVKFDLVVFLFCDMMSSLCLLGGYLDVKLI